MPRVCLFSRKNRSFVTGAPIYISSPQRLRRGDKCARSAAYSEPRELHRCLCRAYISFEIRFVAHRRQSGSNQSRRYPINFDRRLTSDPRRFDATPPISSPRSRGCSVLVSLCQCDARFEGLRAVVRVPMFGMKTGARPCVICVILQVAGTYEVFCRNPERRTLDAPNDVTCSSLLVNGI